MLEIRHEYRFRWIVVPRLLTIPDIRETTQEPEPNSGISQCWVGLEHRDDTGQYHSRQQRLMSDHGRHSEHSTAVDASETLGFVSSAYRKRMHKGTT
jgi:hypothetical protein